MIAANSGNNSGEQSLITGNKQGFRGPSNAGAETRFRPGQSGNPGGRPSRRRITEAMLGVLTENDGELLQKLARMAINKAVKGDLGFFREVLERIEGKSVQPISGPDGGAIPHTIEGIDEYIRELIRPDRARSDLIEQALPLMTAARKKGATANATRNAALQSEGHAS